ncbi:hypothetical protein [Pseudomonas sp. RA_35y_Pfl2_P32]|uniref:hypothetical protein n=1 Tax=Pseudomonas sp. RA_35y_Pfl2_P32 TaxID=3088705 RepID=UPI0030D993CA
MSQRLTPLGCAATPPQSLGESSNRRVVCIDCIQKYIVLNTLVLARMRFFSNGPYRLCSTLIAASIDDFVRDGGQLQAATGSRYSAGSKIVVLSFHPSGFGSEHAD